MTPHPTRTSARRLLLLVLHIQVGEGTRVSLMLLYSMAIGSIFTVGRAVGSSLFLSRLPPAATPYMLILPSIATVLTLLVYNRIAPRFRLATLAVRTATLSMIGFGLFYLLLILPSGKTFGVLGSFFLFLETTAALANLQFWLMATQIFNPREARRLFGLLAVGSTVANATMGLLLSVVVQWVAVTQLLWVEALAFGLCGLVIWLLERDSIAEEPARSHVPAGERSIWADLRDIRRTPLLLWIAALAVLTTLLMKLSSYQFYLTIQTHFSGRPAAMVAFLGQYEFWTALLALGIQLFFVGVVMRRLGLVAALLLLPLSSALGALSAIISGGALWSSTLIRASDPVFRRTINEAGFNVLYLPVPSSLRQTAKRLFEAMLALTSGLLGGLALLANRAPGWQPVYWAILLLVFALVSCALLLPLRQRYLQALTANVGRRRLDLDSATIDVEDTETVRVLAQALSHHDPAQALHALHLIADGNQANWDRHVAPLLAHPSPEVRIGAIEHLGRHDNRAATPGVAVMVNDPDEEVVAAAIMALCAMEGAEAVERVLPLLDAPQTGVRSAAIAGLIKFGGLDGVLNAATHLKALLESSDAGLRQQGARVLGHVGVSGYYSPLIPLFDDPDRAVRTSAIEAAGRLRNPALLPHLQRALADAPNAMLAVDALAAYGDATLPGVRALLADPTSPRNARMLAPRVARRVGGPAAEALLFEYAREPDDEIRSAVQGALARLKPTVPLNSGAVFALDDALMDEIRQYYDLYILHHDLQSVGEDLLLDDAIRTRLEQCLDRIFFVLTIRYPENKVELVRDILTGKHGPTRPMAIELLDNLVERQVRDLLVPLFEAPVTDAVVLAETRWGFKGRTVEERLAELTMAPSPWLRACAIHRIGTLRAVRLSGLVQAAVTDENALVRETAQQAQVRLSQKSTADNGSSSCDDLWAEPHEV